MSKTALTLIGGIHVLLGCTSPEQPTDERIPGYIGTALPIAGAFIDVYELDEMTGEFLSPYPIISINSPSNSDGEFQFSSEEFHSGILLFVGRGGKAKEFWSPEQTKLSSGHLVSIVRNASTMPSITVSPWTTLVYELATGRYRHGDEPTFAESLQAAEDLLFDHLIGFSDTHNQQHCFARLNCLRPTHLAQLVDSDFGLTSDTYALTLVALSAQVAIQSGYSIDKLDSATWTRLYLAKDARDGRLDGRSSDSSSRTTKDTLRSDLGKAFALSGLEAMDYHYSYDRFSLEFERIAFNDNPELFGSNVPNSFDLEPPHIYPIHSPFFDERNDRIVFTEDRVLQRNHDLLSTISLEQVFEPGCVELHKQVDLLRSPSLESNPLRWRFVAYDAVSGIASARAQVTVGSVIRDASTMIVDQRLPDGGYEVVVTATSDMIPELANREDTFSISIVVFDGAGNQSVPLEGCWQHVPRAPPFWLGPIVPAEGSGLILNYSLEADNMSSMLDGSLSKVGGPILSSFEVFNPSDVDIYLVLATTSTAGEFSWRWALDYVYKSSNSGVDSCIQHQICESLPPAFGQSIATPSPNPALPADSFALTINGSSCGGKDCSNWMILLESGASMTVEIRWHDFESLLPAVIGTSDVLEFLDPVDGDGLATGVVREYSYCTQVNEDDTCSERDLYDELITMRAASLAAEGIVFGMSTVDFALTPRSPIGQSPTLGNGYKFSQTWFTNE